jgi:diguanylate cyclase (GGDEF)-like protein
LSPPEAADQPPLLAVPIEPIGPDTSTTLAYDAFSAEPGLSALPVVDDERRPIGLINRFEFLEALSRPLGRDLLMHRPVSSVMDPRPLVVDEHVGAEAISSALVNEGTRYILDGFIVTSRGRYLGVGTGYTLMRLLTEQRQAELFRLAHHDPLTGLPNRQLFADRLTQALAGAERHGHHVAVLYLDVDRFKSVNDVLGHAAGDALLQGIVARLAPAIRAEDTFARLSGDEFAFILTSARGPDDGEVVARKLLALFDEPHTIDGQEVNVSGSIGLAVYPFDGHTADAIRRAADAALYQAKEFRNTWQRYAADRPPRIRTPLAYGAVKRAIDDGRLEVMYQPQIDRASGGIRGLEALVRWRHADGTPLPTPELIRLAEDAGLIGAITDHMLRTALSQLAAWHREGLGRQLRLAINVSGLEVRAGQRGLAPMIVRHLDANALPPTVLELEITESAVMRSGDGTTAVLAGLKDLGIRLAVDDFGVGYSSLSRLLRTPVDAVKIDQSFIHGIGEKDGRTLVRAIVSMAHALRLDVTAEGIETDEQLTYLDQVGCDMLQGYLLGRPLPAAAIGTLLAGGDRS